MSCYNLRISKVVKYLFVGGLVIGQLLDIITTLLIKYKHTVFNESNPLYIMGLNIYWIFGLKVLVFGYLTYFLLRKYNDAPYIFLRYLILYIICLIFIVTFGIVNNNYNVYKLDPEQVTPIDDDLKAKIYKDSVVNMKVVKPKSTGLVGFMFIVNMFQYIIYWCFENERRRNKRIMAYC